MSSRISNGRSLQVGWLCHRQLFPSVASASTALQTRFAFDGHCCVVAKQRAPAIVLALAAQATFCGFKYTKTPLYAIGAGNLLNAILDFILIFLYDFGISGAAVATVISEYLIASILLVELNGRFSLVSPEIDWRNLLPYLQSGGLLISRTVAVLGTSLAAKQGPVLMAGHQICIQIWLAVSLLTDALALAGQALLAPSYSQGDYQQARRVVYRTLQIRLTTGLALSLFLFAGFRYFFS